MVIPHHRPRLPVLFVFDAYTISVLAYSSFRTWETVYDSRLVMQRYIKGRHTNIGRIIAPQAVSLRVQNTTIFITLFHNMTSLPAGWPPAREAPSFFEEHQSTHGRTPAAGRHYPSRFLSTPKPSLPSTRG